MNHCNTTKRYCPHEISTKIHSVELYRQTKDISFVCRRYHISKASLMRWNKQYDGTKESLLPKSHKPHSPHPNAKRNWNGSATITVVTPIFQSANYMENCRKKRRIQDIPAPSIAFLFALVSGKRSNPQRKSPSIPASMTRRKQSAKSGKWMLNMFRLLVIRAEMGRNSINTRS